MPDTIGRITVPALPSSGLTFPSIIRPDFNCGMARPWPVIAHRFGEYSSKAEQCYQVGFGPRKFSFPAQRLNLTQRATLFAFYEEVQGSAQSFLYSPPNPDQTATQYTVIFEAKPLTLNETSNGSTVSFNLVEVPNPATAPEYSIASTCTRFPSTALQAGLLSQVQQLIPLIHIRVRESAVPDIYLSDRRVMVGGQLYLPRVLDIGEPGGNVLFSQNINGAADNVQFTLGNADRVMTALANDTDLKFAEIDLCLYHVNTGILWQFWKGFIQGFVSDGTSKFPLKCSDGLFQVMQMYPNRVADRNCWKTYNDGLYCRWATQGASAAAVTAAGGDPTQCDYTWNGTNGCLVHGMSLSFGGLPAVQQSVSVKDNSTGFIGFDRNTVTATSIISDTIWGQPIPEVWCNQQASAVYAFMTNALIVAVRDNGDYFDILGVVSSGPIGSFTITGDSAGVFVTNADGYTYLCAPLGDGFPAQGLKIASNGESASSNSALGLRQVVGNDPSDADNQGYETFGMANIVGALPAPLGFAAGTAFVELLYPKPSGFAPTLPEQHSLTVPIAQGMAGRIWDTSGNPAWQAGLINPVWIGVNTYLRAIGMAPRPDDDSATIAAQLAIIHPATITVAPIADILVQSLLGEGTEIQFQFQGTLGTQKPFRDWLKEILHCCLGYFSFEFGQLKIGMRINSGAIDAYTKGNMLYQSLHMEPGDCRFEQMVVSFADVAYQYQANTGTYVDKTHAAYYGRPGSPLSAQVHLVGCSSLSQALRIAATEVREEIGGINVSEWRNLRKGFFKTTLLGLNNTIGDVISITDPDVPNMRGTCNVTGTVLTWVSGDSWTDPKLVNKVMLINGVQVLITYVSPVNVTPDQVIVTPAPGDGSNIAWRIITADCRIQTVQVYKDWSVQFGFQTVTDSMYNLDVGPQPLDVAPLPLPVITWPLPLSVWLPWQVQANAIDQLFPNEFTFDVDQEYVQLKDGTVQANIIVTGKLPVTATSPGVAAPAIGSITVGSGGGSVTGGGLWRVTMCALDSNGLPGPAAAIALVNVPAGSNINYIVLDDIEWPVADLSGYVIFASVYDDLICAAQVGSLAAEGGDTYSPTVLTFEGASSTRSGWGAPNPNVSKVRVKVKPLLHSGPAGIAVTSGASFQLVCGELVDTNPSPVDWTGRVCSVIGRPNGSTPFASFGITGFAPSTGTLTLDRDPTGIVEESDAIAIRCQASNLTSTPALVTVVNDPFYENVTNGYGGLGIVDGVGVELGNLIRVIAGTGRGQLPSKITANTATQISFQPALLMDTTSVWIVEGPTWQEQVDTTVLSNLDPTTASSLTLPTVNYIDQPVLIGGFLVDVDGNESPEGDMALREDWIYGEVGAISGAMTLVIPGTLAIGSNLGPAAFYTQTVTLSQGVSIMLVNAPVGADAVFTIYAGSTLLFTVTVADGQTLGSASGTPVIPPDISVIVNLTAVGTTYPGSGATVVFS